jgi:uncharacterized protein
VLTSRIQNPLPSCRPAMFLRSLPAVLLRLCFVFSLLFFWPMAHAGNAYMPDSVPNQRLVDGNHVSDPDGIIDAGSRAEIERVLAEVEQKTGAQVAVVAVESIGDADVFTFAQTLFERWGIGHKGVDDGLLILLVLDQRTVRLHTGYGLEGVLPDAICQRIEQDEMLPPFRSRRYGEGLLAGVREVARLLSDPAAARAAAEAVSPWPDFRKILAIVGAILLAIVFGILNLLGHFTPAPPHQGGRPAAMQWTRKGWLAAFALAPAAIVIVCGEVLPLAHRILICSALLYVHFMLLAVYQAWRQQRALAAIAARGRYRDAGNLAFGEQGFWLFVGLLFPLPFLPYYFFVRSRRRYYRQHPRNCSCGQPMRLLGEDEEDAYLSAAQQTEEKLAAVDYDVWLCAACGRTTRASQANDDSGYEKCPKCKTMAWQMVADTILVKASYEAAGKGERSYHCLHCGHEASTGYKLPRLRHDDTSDSGSSSGSWSSSGSGGSSWGGGSSGGGGSSSSW